MPKVIGVAGWDAFAFQVPAGAPSFISSSGNNLLIDNLPPIKKAKRLRNRSAIPGHLSLVDTLRLPVSLSLPSSQNQRKRIQDNYIHSHTPPSHRSRTTGSTGRGSSLVAVSKRSLFLPLFFFTLLRTLDTSTPHPHSLLVAHSHTVGVSRILCWSQFCRQ